MGHFRKSFGIFLVLLLSLAFLKPAGADAEFAVGTDDFYLSVGDYDYLPYGHSYSNNVNFQAVLGDYGNWVSVGSFGRVWRPYVASGWRPYTNGHWATTSYGQTWVGYEPWAWATHHYGHWIWTRNYGWVWVPGYQYSPGRVTWARGYDTIGWIPTPPPGYDYCPGYLHRHGGSFNQFSYYDDDFSLSFGFGDYGPYYSPRYRPLYYSPGYLSLAPSLFVFIDSGYWGYDNYAPYYLAPRYTRSLFDRRLIRLYSRPLHRDRLQRIVKTRLREVPVRVRDLRIDGRRVRYAWPQGEEVRIRRHANRVVKEYIAPAYAERGRNFDGRRARNVESVDRFFNQRNRQPRLERVSRDRIITNAREVRNSHEKRRNASFEKKAQQLERFDRDRGRQKEKIEKARGVNKGKESVKKFQENQFRSVAKEETRTKTKGKSANVSTKGKSSVKAIDTKVRGKSTQKGPDRTLKAKGSSSKTQDKAVKVRGSSSKGKADKAVKAKSGKGSSRTLSTKGKSSAKSKVDKGKTPSKGKSISKNTTRKSGTLKASGKKSSSKSTIKKSGGKKSSISSKSRKEAPKLKKSSGKKSKPTISPKSTKEKPQKDRNRKGRP